MCNGGARSEDGILCTACMRAKAASAGLLRGSDNPIGLWISLAKGEGNDTTKRA